MEKKKIRVVGSFYVDLARKLTIEGSSGFSTKPHQQAPDATRDFDSGLAFTSRLCDHVQKMTSDFLNIDLSLF
jgi:hypothetical protein